VQEDVRLGAVALRYFNVFGRQDPGSTYSGVISRFLSAVHPKSPRGFGDGEQTRDFVYVENVVQANLLACHAENALGQVINIGTGKARVCSMSCEPCPRLLGRNRPGASAAARGGHSPLARRHRSARQALGYEIQVSFEEGLRRTLEWFRITQESNPRLRRKIPI